MRTLLLALAVLGLLPMASSTLQVRSGAQTPLPDGYGAIAGMVLRQCGSSPLSGCQGQGIPDTIVKIHGSDDAVEISVRTARDGSIWVAVLPGLYAVEDAESGQTEPVMVQLGEVSSITLTVPR